MKEITIPLQKVYDVFDKYVAKKVKIIDSGNHFEKAEARIERCAANDLQIDLLTMLNQHKGKKKA